MRDAIGGSSLLYLVIIFVTVVMLLFSTVLTYAKAYGVKNRIIEIIEKYETYDSTTANEINSNLKSLGYDSSNPNRCNSIKGELESSNGKYKFGSLTSKNEYGYNYCVFETSDTSDVTNGKYYVVVTFSRFEFPIIGDVFSFPIYGETKILGKNYNYE